MELHLEALIKQELMSLPNHKDISHFEYFLSPDHKRVMVQLYFRRTDDDAPK